MKISGVYKFDNDMIMTFDEKGKQIPELQGQYTQELHEKINRLSDPNTVWDGFNNPINFRQRVSVIKQIRNN